MRSGVDITSKHVTTVDMNNLCRPTIIITVQMSKLGRNVKI